MAVEATNWFTSMFSGDVKDGDVVTAGTLNITKITVILVPMVTAAVAAVNAAIGKDGPLADLTPGQRLMVFLAAFGLVGLVILTDMAVRGYVTGKQMAGSPGDFVRFPTPLVGLIKRNATDHQSCEIFGLHQPAVGSAEFIVVVKDSDGKAIGCEWAQPGQLGLGPADG